MTRTTDAGKRSFRDWLAQIDDPADRRNEWVAKTAFERAFLPRRVTTPPRRLR